MADPGWTLEPAEAQAAPAGWSLEAAPSWTDRAIAAAKNPRTYTGLLPAAGATVGGILAAPGLITGAVGAGMGAAAGKGLEHIANTALGYEKPIENASDFGDQLGEMGKEGATTAAVTAGLSAGAKYVAAPILKKLASAAESMGISMGRRAITGGASLQNATREALPDQAVRAAYDEGAIRAGSSTQGIADRLQVVRDQLGEQKGRILVALKQAGITGPSAEALADRMAMEGRTAAATATNPGVRGAYDAESSALRAREVAPSPQVRRPASWRDMPPEDPSAPVNLQHERVARALQKMIDEGELEPMGEAERAVYSREPAVNSDAEYGQFTVPRDPQGNLDLVTSEARKTAAMNDASYGNYSDTAINQAKQGVGNIYKTANEDAITQGAAASGNPATQAIADQFQPLKERLGNVIAASDVANIGAGRAMNRAVISPKTAAFTAAKMASGAGIPDAALTAGVTGLAMSRGTSAMSAAGFGTASAMQKLQSIVRTNPGAIGRYGAILSKALSEGDQSFAANTYALSQSDPQFQQLQRQLNGEK